MDTVSSAGASRAPDAGALQGTQQLTASPPTPDMPAIELVGIAKSFHSRRGNVMAVDGIDLAIGAGEFFSLLGPSGCGKTTTLRMIGGFEDPTAGQILLYGKNVVGVPPNHRDVNMVFQSYALFPHMSVLDNVAFGLRRKSVPKAEITRRVGEMLELVQLEGKSDRRPRELSGGQQQRVALARALVNRPRALLLDEPLAALDLKLRQAMQGELKRIQREVGITFVFVTHDQNEALTMSDRLVVMNAGRIEQLGAPREVYERPRTRFVAGFIGTSNVLTGRVRAIDGTTAVLERPPEELLVVPDALDVGAVVGQPLELTVRPEKIVISPVPRPGWCALRGRVNEVVYLGTSTHYAVTTSDGADLLVFAQNASDAGDIAQRGSQVWLSWRPDHSLPLAAA
jgi:spermidine/putrescine transport system ATP-binding protein